MSHSEQPSPQPTRGDPSREPESDAAALARYVDGDDEGLVLLVRRHQRLLRHVAWQVVHDESDAEDVVQAAWLAVINGASGFRGGSTVVTWLVRIVRNQALDRLRRRAARPRIAAGIDDLNPTAATADQVSAVEADMMQRDLLGELPPAQRAAIVLVDLHGLSIEDAAELLDVAPGTIKSRRCRGRARLAALVAARERFPST